MRMEGFIALCVKGAVTNVKDEIKTLLEVEVVETMVAHTDDSGLGGRTPPVVTVIVGIEEFPEEVVVFVSIAACDTVWHP
jgi:hypothetical protein